MPKQAEISMAGMTKVIELLGETGELLAKGRLLHDRVVQFRVRVRQFHAVDVKLKPLGDRGVAGRRLAERA